MGLRGRISDDGFTLIELAVAMAIVAILAAVLVPIVTGYVNDARIARAAADVKAISSAISNFEKDVGRYPMFTSAATGLSDGGANVVRLEIPGSGLAESTGTSPWTASSPISGTDCLAASCTTSTFDN